MLTTSSTSYSSSKYSSHSLERRFSNPTATTTITTSSTFSSGGNEKSGDYDRGISNSKSLSQNQLPPPPPPLPSSQPPPPPSSDNIESSPPKSLKQVYSDSSSLNDYSDFSQVGEGTYGY